MMIRQTNTRELIEAVLRGESPQKNYQQAYDLAIAAARKVPANALERLAVACKSADQLSVAVLAGNFHVDLTAGKVKDDLGQDAPAAWAILVLHYLVSRPPEVPVGGYISFMDIPDARGYARPYQGRVVKRFLYTAGRDEATFRSAAEKLAGKKVDAGDAAYEFALFPRAHMLVIWYRGDNEVSAGASFLYAREIADIFCVEDIVVMSELLVKALSAQK